MDDLRDIAQKHGGAASRGARPPAKARARLLGYVASMERAAILSVRMFIDQAYGCNGVRSAKWVFDLRGFGGV